MNKQKIVNIAALGVTLAGIVFGTGAQARADGPRPRFGYTVLRHCEQWRIVYFPVKHKTCVKWSKFPVLVATAQQ